MSDQGVMSRIEHMTDIIRKATGVWVIDPEAGGDEFLRGITPLFSSRLGVLRLFGYSGGVRLFHSVDSEESPGIQGTEELVLELDRVVPEVVGSGEQEIFSGSIQTSIVSGWGSSWHVFPLWNHLEVQGNGSSGVALTLAGYCVLVGNDGSDGAWGLTVLERDLTASALRGFLSSWRLRRMGADGRTGFFRMDGFRAALESLVSGPVVDTSRFHVAALSFSGLSSGSSSLQLSRREALLGELWTYITGRYQIFTYMAMDVHDNLFICGPGGDQQILAKRYRAFREDLSRHSTFGSLVSDSCIGIAIWPLDGRGAAELLHRSRQALAWATRGKDGNLLFFERSRMTMLQTDERFYWTDNDLLNYLHTGLLLESIEALRFTGEQDRLECFIVDKAIEVTGAERGILLMLDPAGKPTFHRGRLAGQRDLATLPDISWSIPRRVLESGDAACFVTMDHDATSQAGQSIQQLQLLSVMCSPLRIKDNMVGILYVDSKKSRLEFADADLTFFQALAKQMSLTLEVAHLFADNVAKQKEIEQLNDRLLQKLDEQTIRMIDMEKEIATSRSQLSQQFSYGNIIGASSRMKEMFSLIDRIAPYAFPVLIEGESGTGKELVARAVHVNSPRKNARFVSENCGAIPDTLFEAELFGHEKGAFTGADRDKLGLIRLAEGGTLFLDEIANMSDAMQKGILRVIQEQEVRPVGGKTSSKVDVRIICSSNIPLMDLVREGKFRKDLFYRLNVIALRLPPLRERKEDIPLLVKHFLDKTARQTNGPLKRVHPGLLEPLLQYDWPGNVRELENEIRRIYILSDNELKSEFLSPHIITGSRDLECDPSEEATPLSIKDQERSLIISALKASGGNKKKAAERLGISRTNLYQKLALYDIQSRRDY